VYQISESVVLMALASMKTMAPESDAAAPVD